MTATYQQLIQKAQKLGIRTARKKASVLRSQINQAENKLFAFNVGDYVETIHGDHYQITSRHYKPDTPDKVEYHGLVVDKYGFPVQDAWGQKTTNYLYDSWIKGIFTPLIKHKVKTGDQYYHNGNYYAIVYIPDDSYIVGCIQIEKTGQPVQFINSGKPMVQINSRELDLNNFRCNQIIH